MTPDLVLTCVGLGIVLSMACGLRAFLVPFGLACAQGMGWVNLGPDMAWLGTPVAIGTFGAAIIVEILADKIPAIDHAMDVAHLVLKPAAGTVAAMALMPGSDPLIHTVAGLATGGVVAGSTHLGKALFRYGSTASTLGTGNWVVSLVEDAAAIALGGGATWALTTLS